MTQGPSGAEHRMPERSTPSSRLISLARNFEVYKDLNRDFDQVPLKVTPPASNVLSVAARFASTLSNSERGVDNQFPKGEGGQQYDSSLNS